MNQQLIDTLLDPATYPHAPSEVTTLETHISRLFFAGDRVYKVKKPVKLSFLDFSTLEARKHFCEEELRLNRRLSDWMYLGLCEIRRRPDGSLGLGGEGTLKAGTVVEYAVEMHRLPAERMLDRLLTRGEVDNGMMRALASKLAEFHASSATGPGIDEHGSFAAIHRNCLENFEETLAFTSEPGPICLSPAVHEYLRRQSEDFLEQNRELFAGRVAQGRIREGHGDLHAGNICILDADAERIAIYDCLEFSARFRCGDVAADLAFLLMDLDLHCFRGFASFLLHEYLQISGDHELLALIDYYKGYRAMVRGKVSGLRAVQSRAEEREASRLEAMRCFNLAASYFLPPSLVLTCGLPGSGKSWIASQLARSMEFAVFNSDRSRKQLGGIPARSDASDAYEAGLYSPARSEETYAELLRKARRALQRGRSVVIDAGLRTEARRAPFLRLAGELGSPLMLLHLDPAEKLIRKRLEERSKNRNSVSDADLAIYEQAKQSFEPPDEIATSQQLMIGEELTSEELAAALIERLIDR